MSEVKHEPDLPLDHIAVMSSDLAADEAFYAKLGFAVETRYNDWVMLRDRQGRGLALLSPAGHHPPHFGLRASSWEELDEMARRFDARLAPHRDGSVSIYLKDPSGNAFEVVYYPKSAGSES